jgi:prepilin-type N-terminal cleavage/methylation domain-containing protein
MKIKPSINCARRGGTAGFSMVELLVSMAISVVVLGAATMAMQHATRLNETAMVISGMNNSLRIGMDMVVRDLLQVGSGLPTGHAILTPSGAGSTRVKMPGPPGTAFTNAVGDVDMNAVNPEPGLGPVINGAATDVLTVLTADNNFINEPLTAITNTTIDVATTNVATGLAINIATGPDRVQPGQLLMLEKGATTTLVEVTSVDTVNRRITFADGDALNLNQSGAAAGNIASLRATAPPDVLPTLPATQVIPTNATRMRMITYYLDNTDANHPRLVRRINNGSATVFDNTSGVAVAMEIENLLFTFDIADGLTNPSTVRFSASDLAGTGACAPNPCNVNQVRKINVLMTSHSKKAVQLQGQMFRNTLTSQVSLRGMAFVDEYLAP